MTRQLGVLDDLKRLDAELCSGRGASGPLGELAREVNRAIRAL